MNKPRIRKTMLSERNKMSKEEVKELSKKIMDTLKKLPLYKNSKTIMVYLNFGNEVDSTEIIKDAMSNGKTIALPYCDKTDMSITPTRITDLELDLSINKMGYLQPKKESLDPIDPFDIDLIILPGIVFDKKGFRIGFGAGYYDRFLGKMNFKVPTVGVAYDFQIIDSFIMMEDYDIPVDYVLTEERVIIRTE